MRFLCLDRGFGFFHRVEKNGVSFFDQGESVKSWRSGLWLFLMVNGSVALAQPLAPEARLAFAAAGVQYADQYLAEAETRLGDLEHFIHVQDAHMAAAKPVQYPDRRALENVQAMLDRAADLVKSDDSRLTEGCARFMVVKKADARLRAALATDTRIQSDVYAGSDAAELKLFSEQLVAQVQPGLILLKTVLVSPHWKEENRKEWADPAQTVLQNRTMRSLTAQVAGRVNAETRLYTVALTQDRLSAGTWGPTRGRVLFTDPMLGENVK